MSRRRLDSWKEIAEFFDRDRTVVARWERERGLSVHRVPGGRKGRVFAYTDELEAWLQSAPKEPPVEVEHGRAPRRTWLISAAVLPLIAGVSGALWAARRAPGHVAAVVYSPDALVAVDDQQREVFRAPFPGRVFVTEPRPGLGLLARRDFDRDGRDDSLVSIPLKLADGSTGAVQDLLNAYRDDGGLLWSQSIDSRPKFGGGDFGPGYQTTAAMPFSYQGATLVAWSETHHMWWPTILQVLDDRGRVRSRWTHAGVFFALSFLEHAEGRLLLAGGVSNSRSAGAMIALHLEQANGHGPESEGSEFACTDCAGADRPGRYFVFPPTEMSAAYGVPYSRVYAINATSGGIEVRARQGSLSPGAGVDASYNFDRDFHLAHKGVADDYWLVHRQMEQKGVFDHSADACPERTRPLIVREWTGSSWIDLIPGAAK
jgi:hypothetical protein